MKREPLYIEWAPKVNRRSGLMIQISSVKNILKSKDPGFRSVYMFPESAAKEIRDSGESRGFKKYPLFSDRLFIDLDNGYKDVAKVQEFLEENSYSYKLYSSGGKGYHFEIETSMLKDCDVPASQLAFVQTLGIQVDESIYRPNSIISLPGRIHPKTGNRKELVKDFRGFNLLEIEPVVQELVLPTVCLDQDLDNFEIGLTQLQTYLNRQPKLGRRHEAIWSTAKNFADAGMSYEATLELLSMVNDSWENPKDDEELERAVSQAFGL